MPHAQACRWWLASPLGGLDLVGSALARHARAQCSGDKISQRGTDLIRTILLDEVDATDFDLALIWPSATEVQRAPDQNRTRFRRDEQLGQTALAQPFAVLGHDG